jgi:CcmD family protein
MSIRRSSSLSFLFAALVAVVVLLRAGRASAEDAAPPASDHSMRAVCQQELARDHAFAKIACEDELAKDPAWFNDLKGRLADQLNRNVHTDAAHYATTNNKHVVAAYAVFWILTAGFVLMMWRRQRALQAELVRLERDLARALKEGGAA